MTTLAPLSIWFAIPSANRALAAITLPLWSERGYRVALQLDDGQTPPAKCDARICRPYAGWPEAVNYLARWLVASEGADIVITGGDDVYPVRDRTAQEIGAEFRERFPDLCGLMQPEGDGFSGNGMAAVSPWIGSGWVRRAYGGAGPIFPGYWHYCSDTELCAVAEKCGRYWRRPELAQYHAHWTRSPEKRPYRHLASAQTAKGRDRELYLSRKAAGFPGAELLEDAP